MIKLTIAIPTFNRNLILKKNLAYLLPQLTSECEVLILDNASPVPVSKTLKNLLTKYSKLNIRIIRNLFNVGGDENTFRCIEYALGEYVWWLGDDDIVSEIAVDLIFSEINHECNPAVINMHANIKGHQKRKWFYGKGSILFLEQFKNFNEALFISCMIFKKKYAVKYLVTLFHSQTSCSGQLVLMTKILNDSEFFIVSNKSIINDAGEARKIESQSYFINTLINLNTSILNPWSLHDYLAIKKLMNSNWLLKIGLCVIKDNLYDLVMHKKITKKELIHKINLLISSSYNLSIVNKQNISYKILKLMILISPRLTLTFLFNVMKLTKSYSE